MDQSERPSFSSPGLGFLGPTSFSADYIEDKSLKGLNDQPQENLTTSNGGNRRVYSPGRDSQVQKGANCLALLQNMDTYKTLIDKWNTSVELSMIAPWIRACQSSVEADVYHHLANPVGRHIYAAKVFENSLRPLATRREHTMDDFAALMTGRNLRWEAIGMYLTAVGLAALTVNDAGQAGRRTQEARYYLAKQMLEASDVCISFCEELGQLTDPGLWLTVENTHLCSVLEGDASM